MTFTLVCFHAHPDDEAMLTAGTMAKAAAAGHRVVVVVATAGEQGQVADSFLSTRAPGAALGSVRMAELEASAEALGVSRVECLGFTDSGTGGALPPGSFVDAEPGVVAARLSSILAEEHADVVTTYDRNGGYGHRDHLRVHAVGRSAARLAGTPVVLEATVNRDLFGVGVQLARGLGYELPPDLVGPVEAGEMDSWFLPAEEITTFVDVSAHLDAKRASMAAHASQTTGGDETQRTLAAFLSLPDEYFAMAFGTEWFKRVDPAPVSTCLPEDSVFAVLERQRSTDPGS